MGMKSGEFGLSETLQNKISSLLNYNNKIGEIDENKRKGKEAEEEEMLIDERKFKRHVTYKITYKI